MSISRFTAGLALSVTLSAGMFAQSVVPQIFNNSALAAAGPPADEANPPKLERFDPDAVDKTLDPCNDFYKYSCNKWLTANPIPPDQVFWSTGSGLQLWNENLLR